MANINLVVLPRKILTWDEFLKVAPKNSIALDGVVSGGPAYDEKNLHVNFDHHDGVVREATMSTAMQVYLAIKSGLFKAFRKDGEVFAEVYVNDCDQDTSFAYWLLKNHHLFEGVNSIQGVNRILRLTDALDITGGSFPVNLSEELARQMAWIFQPYTSFRKSGRLYLADEKEIKEILESVCLRLDKLLTGDCGQVDLDTSHEIIYKNSKFQVIDEIGGNDARYFLFSEGMDAFISLVARRKDGNFVYSIGRRSRYVPFPVSKLYEHFNKIEKISDSDCWGGSDIVGGSPRQRGSKIKPEEIGKITADYLKKNNYLN